MLCSGSHLHKNQIYKHRDRSHQYCNSQRDNDTRPDFVGIHSHLFNKEGIAKSFNYLQISLTWSLPLHHYGFRLATKWRFINSLRRRTAGVESTLSREKKEYPPPLPCCWNGDALIGLIECRALVDCKGLYFTFALMSRQTCCEEFYIVMVLRKRMKTSLEFAR